MARIKQLTKFQDKLKNISSFNMKKAATDSMAWMRQNIGKRLGHTVDEFENRWVYRKLPGVDREFKDAISQSKVPLVGHMYFYIYDPKWKQTLPYYDTFPLVVPIGYKSGGMLALNFHYLPPMMRARLLDALFSVKQYTLYNGRPQDFINISYDMLKGMGKTPYAPTIKRYLWTHVKSNFARIDSEEWEQAVFLPVESFKKANKRAVWSDSREMVA